MSVTVLVVWCDHPVKSCLSRHQLYSYTATLHFTLDSSVQFLVQDVPGGCPHCSSSEIFLSPAPEEDEDQVQTDPDPASLSSAGTTDSVSARSIYQSFPSPKLFPSMLIFQNVVTADIRACNNHLNKKVRPGPRVIAQCSPTLRRRKRIGFLPQLAIM